MPEQDVGWAGSWEPNIVSSECLAELRNRAGEPIMGRNGRPLTSVRVNLETGEFIYSAQAGSKSRRS